MKTDTYYRVIQHIEKYIHKNGAEDRDLEIHLNENSFEELNNDLMFMFGFNMSRFDNAFNHYGVELKIVRNYYCYDGQVAIVKPCKQIIFVPSFNFPMQLKMESVQGKAPAISEVELMIIKNFVEEQKMRDYELQLNAKEIKHRAVRVENNEHISIVISEEDLYSYEFRMNGVNAETIAVCASYAKRKIQERIDSIYNDSRANWHDKPLYRIPAKKIKTLE